MAFTGSLFVIIWYLQSEKFRIQKRNTHQPHYCCQTSCQINLDKSQRPPYKPHRFLDGVITVLPKIFIDEVMRNMLRPIILLALSNLFMTFAWYGHLKNMNGKPLFLIILLSWGIAFFEYVLQVPANRIGIHYFNLGQLKVIQEIITMIIFAGFAFFYMKQPLKLDYLWAGLCLVGAAYFMFREGISQA